MLSFLRLSGFSQCHHYRTGHGSGAHDWIQIDLQGSYPVSSVTFYNRADCCQQRASGAALTLMNSNRVAVGSVSLNSGLVQTSRFNSPYTAAQNALNSAEAAAQADSQKLPTLTPRPPQRAKSTNPNSILL